MHKAFRVHMLNEEGKALASEIAAAFDELAGKLQIVCPSGREFAIVVTKLEEACFFAKKSIAEVADNQADAATTVIERPAPTPTPIGERPKLPEKPPQDPTAIVAASEAVDVKAPKASSDAKAPHPSSLFAAARNRSRAEGA